MYSFYVYSVVFASSYRSRLYILCIFSPRLLTEQAAWIRGRETSQYQCYYRKYSKVDEKNSCTERDCYLRPHGEGGWGADSLHVHILLPSVSESEIFQLMQSDKTTFARFS